MIAFVLRDDLENYKSKLSCPIVDTLVFFDLLCFKNPYKEEAVMFQSKYPKIVFAVFLAIAFFLSSVVGPAPVAYAQDEEPPQTEEPTEEIPPVETEEPSVVDTGEEREAPPPEDDSDVEGQIVAGNNADPGEWPWQVFLEVLPGDYYYYYDQFCGGTLIDPYWVVTAAHCVTDSSGKVISTNSFRVVAGGHQLTMVDSAPIGTQVRNVAKIIRHPNYNDNTLNNDIALIKLSSPFTLVPGPGLGAVATLPIATPSMGNWTGSAAWVTGWGKNSATQSSFSRKDILQEASVKVISNTECAATYGSAITDNMLCTKFASKKSVCSGDSGGLLAIDRNGLGNWVLVGVVSFSSVGCNAASGYARVSKYTSWINGHMAAPGVKSITRLDASPTKADSVRFKVVFTKSVNGVDASDFNLTGTASGGASVTSVTGTGNTRTVTVTTGSGNGFLRLNVVDNDSIVDTNFTPLGGVNSGNGNFTTGAEYVMAKITTIAIYYSTDTYDGWVLESSETSNKGGTINSSATTLRVGDDAKNKQYRSILDFDTSTNPIPPSASLFKVTIQMKRQGITGSNPFSALGAIQVDYKGYFGTSDSLEKADFQSSASKKGITKFTSKNSGGWYSAVIGSANYGLLDRDGINQFRLHFTTDDNNDFLANYISFYSGNADVANQPQLIIEHYTLP
jgi:secreted trypsin-like serine protease